MVAPDLVFDTHAALERVDQDKELLLELCQMFFAQQDASLSALQSALRADDLASARELSHSMKSALGNLGAMQAYRIAQQIELSCKEEQGAAAREAVHSFELALADFRKAVDLEFSSHVKSES
jgi:HPt (histidine-containing phosphotransfer) domain-containing protein